MSSRGDNRCVWRSVHDPLLAHSWFCSVPEIASPVPMRYSTQANALLLSLSPSLPLSLSPSFSPVPVLHRSTLHPSITDSFSLLTYPETLKPYPFSAVTHLCHLLLPSHPRRGGTHLSPVLLRLWVITRGFRTPLHTPPVCDSQGAAIILLTVRAR